MCDGCVDDGCSVLSRRIHRCRGNYVYFLLLFVFSQHVFHVLNLCFDNLKQFVFRLSVTELLYQVSFRGSLRTNGQDVAPTFNSTDIETVVSSVSVYNGQLPTSGDSLFSLVLDGIPASRDFIQQSLTTAWRLQFSK